MCIGTIYIYQQHYKVYDTHPVPGPNIRHSIAYLDSKILTFTFFASKFIVYIKSN